MPTQGNPKSKASPQRAATAPPPALDPAVAHAFAEFGTIAATLGIRPEADSFTPSKRACEEPPWCVPKPDCTALHSLSADQLEALDKHLARCKPVQ